MKTITFAIAGLLIATSASAQSDVLASTEGTFTQAFAGAGDTAPVYSGIGTPGFSFGSGDPSSLYFAGANGDFSDRYVSPDPFFLGSIYYYNGSIGSTSGISAVTLSLITQLSAPANPAGDGVGTRDELIYITNTPNSTDPVASADFITFSSLGKGAFVFEGQRAIFNLVGTLNSPLTITDIVLVSDASTGFVAPSSASQPISLVAGVPEPATWTMMLGGFGLVGGAMRSSRRKTRVSFAGM